MCDNYIYNSIFIDSRVVLKYMPLNWFWYGFRNSLQISKMFSNLITYLHLILGTLSPLGMILVGWNYLFYSSFRPPLPLLCFKWENMGTIWGRYRFVVCKMNQSISANDYQGLLLLTVINCHIQCYTPMSSLQRNFSELPFKFDMDE